MSVPVSPSEPFTSDLTVDEFLLIANAGWEPVAFVSGDTTYTAGRQASSYLRSKELNWISDALGRGHGQAIARMRKQAEEAGAHGVVGVRLETLDFEAREQGSRPHHFSAVGTAVRPIRTVARAPKPPFTSHLSGQDTWSLLTAGYMPVGLVFGFSVYHAATQYKHLRECAEMPALTDALYSARELAMRRMQSQARRVRAAGIVGVDVDMQVDGPTITFAATGTAVAVGPAGGQPVAPRMAVALNDGGLR